MRSLGTGTPGNLRRTTPGRVGEKDGQQEEFCASAWKTFAYYPLGASNCGAVWAGAHTIAYIMSVFVYVFLRDRRSASRPPTQRRERGYRLSITNGRGTTGERTEGANPKGAKRRGARQNGKHAKHTHNAKRLGQDKPGGSARSTAPGEPSAPGRTNERRT